MSTARYKNQLIPPPELDSPPPASVSFDQLLFAWSDLMDSCDYLLRANLRRLAGSKEDATSEYRKWYAAEMQDHDRMIQHMLTELSKRERNQ